MVISKDCALAVATVPIVLVVNGLEAGGGVVPAGTSVNAIAVAMLLVVEPSGPTPIQLVPFWQPWPCVRYLCAQ